jgi:hypothetical protein
METGRFTPQPGQPSDGVERPRQPEQATEPAYETAAAPATSRESRMADPAVGTDGQLVEAGYGHGV